VVQSAALRQRRIGIVFVIGTTRFNL
jgi:hypothetical protein